MIWYHSGTEGKHPRVVGRPPVAEDLTCACSGVKHNKVRSAKVRWDAMEGDGRVDVEQEGAKVSVGGALNYPGYFNGLEEESGIRRRSILRDYQKVRLGYPRDESAEFLHCNRVDLNLYSEP